MNKDEWRQRAEELDRSLRAKFRDQLEIVSNEDPLDEDGYPTENALKLISVWHWSDAKNWFEFIKSIWAYRDWGWTETVGGVDEFTDQELEPGTIRYHISTAGWSGNESIIHAMQKADMLWSLNWVQSRRGGHYIFELREIDE